jgi:hypothetical protein
MIEHNCSLGRVFNFKLGRFVNETFWSWKLSMMAFSIPDTQNNINQQMVLRTITFSIKILNIMTFNIFYELEHSAQHFNESIARFLLSWGPSSC